MTVTEKVAYLKGLAEGLEIAENSKEGKLLKAVMDILSDLALSVEDLEDYTAELTEQVDAIDEDLDSLEKDFYEDDDCDCDCGCEDDEDWDGEFYDVTCPTATRSSASTRRPFWKAASTAPTAASIWNLTWTSAKRTTVIAAVAANPTRRNNGILFR